MSGPWSLGFRHAMHHPMRSALLALCVAITAALPLSVRSAISGFKADLTARAARTPLVIGAKGNRFDLTMSLLYFRRSEVPTITMADYERLVQERSGVVIPLNLRLTARGRPIVATTPEYLELRGLSPAVGTVPQMQGDALIGATAAKTAGLRVGDSLYSDQRDLFDIAKPQALKMRVVGVLPPTGLPEDEAVIVDLGSAWIMEGLSHSHKGVTEVPASLILDKSDSGVTLSEELIPANEVTMENAASYHLHADSAHLPLTGLIVAPSSTKEHTILNTRINAGKTLQAASPEDVVRDLLGYVFRFQSLMDVVSGLVGVLTATLFAVVTALSVRVRAREIETYRRVGISRASVAVIFGSELVLLVAIGAAAGLLAAWVASGFGPELVKLL